MKILVCKTFGLGNAVLSVPMIRAIRGLPNVEGIDVLVGNTFDDAGAVDVFDEARKIGLVDDVWIDKAPGEYGVAILSIPYDGRWREGVHFRAKATMDGRTRPDPTTTGLVSWEKHEVEYQVDNARALGYVGAVPSARFTSVSWSPPKEPVLYLGVGYKRDMDGFWKRKHWGNENFAALADAFVESHPRARVCVTGSVTDFVETIVPMLKKMKNPGRIDVSPRVYGSRWESTLRRSFELLASCSAYAGNDTGMMHVAASLGMPVAAYFNLGEKSIVKNRPWCECGCWTAGPFPCRRSVWFDGTMGPVAPKMMLAAVRDLLDEATQ